MREDGSDAWRPIVLFLFFGDGRAYGEDASVLSFREYLEKVIELRSQLTSYDLTVTGIVRNAQRAALLTDGKAHIVERVPRRFTLEMAVDPEQRVQSVARKEWYSQVSAHDSYEEVEKESDWLLNIRVGDWQIIRAENSEAGPRPCPAREYQ